MAVRSHDDRPVDIGASYFTVSDPTFQEIVQDWQSRGLARPWTDTFTVYDADKPSRTSTGPMRWAAPGGLRSLVEDLASALDVREQTIKQVLPGPIVDGSPADVVVLAMPDPQAIRLLSEGFSDERGVLDHQMEPVLALTAGWSARQWGQLEGAFVNGTEEVSWIADDGQRRGDSAPILVAHSTPAYAAEHLEDPQSAAGPMLAAVRRVLDIPSEPEWIHLHRWSFARPIGSRDSSFYLSETGIGVCGDSWSDRPRVEAAYLSGVALARAILTRSTA